jgi:hypothetical protein
VSSPEHIPFASRRWATVVSSRGTSRIVCRRGGSMAEYFHCYHCCTQVVSLFTGSAICSRSPGGCGWWGMPPPPPNTRCFRHAMPKSAAGGTGGAGWTGWWAQTIQLIIRQSPRKPVESGHASPACTSELLHCSATYASPTPTTTEMLNNIRSTPRPNPQSYFMHRPDLNATPKQQPHRYIAATRICRSHLRGARHKSVRCHGGPRCFPAVATPPWSSAQ